MISEGPRGKNGDEWWEDRKNSIFIRCFPIGMDVNMPMHI